ncbi:MAG: hypothetical protein KDD13_11840, partial [Mangrovimonas sp.]|nr:hypothetical protein [Mangrovimonas sp.]
SSSRYYIESHSLLVVTFLFLNKIAGREIYTERSRSESGSRYNKLNGIKNSGLGFQTSGNNSPNYLIL